MNDNLGNNLGTYILGITAALLILLRVTGVILWSWWLVTVTLWVPTLMVLACAVVIVWAHWPPAPR